MLKAVRHRNDKKLKQGKGGGIIKEVGFNATTSEAATEKTKASAPTSPPPPPPPS